MHTLWNADPILVGSHPPCSGPRPWPLPLHPAAWRSPPVAAGATRDVRMALARAVQMAEHGYNAGEPDLHFPRQTERDEETIRALLEAEDLGAGCVLRYSGPAGPYTGLMDKQAAP